MLALTWFPVSLCPPWIRRRATQSAIHGGLGAPLLSQPKASSWDSPGKLHKACCDLCSTQNQIPALSTQNETRAPHGLLVHHTLIVTLGHHKGHPVTRRFTLHGTAQVSGFKRRGKSTPYSEDTATPQKSSKQTKQHLLPVPWALLSPPPTRAAPGEGELVALGPVVPPKGMHRRCCRDHSAQEMARGSPTAGTWHCSFPEPACLSANPRWRGVQASRGQDSGPSCPRLMDEPPLKPTQLGPRLSHRMETAAHLGTGTRAGQLLLPGPQEGSCCLLPWSSKGPRPQLPIEPSVGSMVGRKHTPPRPAALRSEETSLRMQQVNRALLAAPELWEQRDVLATWRLWATSQAQTQSGIPGCCRRS